MVDKLDMERLEARYGHDQLAKCPLCKTLRHRSQFWDGLVRRDECNPCRQSVRDLDAGLRSGAYGTEEVLGLFDRWGNVLSAKPADPLIRPQFDPNTEPEIVPDLKGYEPPEDEQ